MMKAISIIVLSVGMIAAVCASAKLPAEGETWPTTWGIAVVGILVTLGGAIGWRRSDAQAAAASAAATKHDAGRQNPLQLMEAMREPLRQLRQDANNLNVAELESRIDQLIESYVLPVSEARRQLIAELGVSKAAEVLIDFSATERRLNRAWSAAGDGDLEEAVASLAAIDSEGLS